MQEDGFLKRAPVLLNWFEQNKRAFPWRDNPHSYKTWICEVMTQQSTMAMVLPYFNRWMTVFPTVESLAGAQESQVLKQWEGLGYYSRARNVHKAALAIVDFKNTNNRWPQKYEEWIEFPGVGPYTASAICSIAFAEKVLPLDGNVIRVLARFFQIKDPLNKASDLAMIKKSLETISHKLPQGKHGPMAEALMELGATVCRPGAQALCEKCPLRETCRAYKSALKKKDFVHSIPRVKARKENKKITVLGLVYRNKKGDVLVRKIPTHAKRLAGQWELPQWENPKELHWEQLQKDYSVFGPVSHQITHHSYKLWAIEAGPWIGKLPAGHEFQNPTSHKTQTLTTATRKLLKLL